MHRFEIFEPRLNLSGGTNGDDTLVATAGLDTLTGLLGDDTYLYDDINSVGIYEIGDNTHSGSDILLEGGGFDIVKFTDPGARLIDFSFSYSGNDLIMSADSGPATGGSITFQNQRLGGDSSFEEIQFWNGDTETSVVDLAHLVIGTSGNDILSGSSFNDSICAHEGNDIINGSEGNDYINGGPGVNTIDYSALADAIYANLSQGNVASKGASGSDTLVHIQNVIGTNLADSILGVDNKLADNEIGDTIHGGAGDDQVGAFGYNHHLYGDDGDDTVSDAGPPFYSQGNNYLNGGAGSDMLLSLWAVNDRLYGDDPTGDFNFDGNVDQTDYNLWRSEFRSSGANLAADANGDGHVDTADYVAWRHASEQAANAGIDTLYIGGGITTVYGGGKADTFALGFLGLGFVVGRDEATILDFHPNTDGDSLDVSYFLGNYNPSTSALSDYVRVEQQGPDTLLKLDIDGTGTDRTFDVVARLLNTQAASVDPATLVASGHLLVIYHGPTGSGSAETAPSAVLEFSQVRRSSGAGEADVVHGTVVDAAFAELNLAEDGGPNFNLLNLVARHSAYDSLSSEADASATAHGKLQSGSSDETATLGQSIGLAFGHSI